VIAFSALMFAFAARMALAKDRPADAARGRRALGAILAIGVLVGVLTGVLGVGGGFVIVPALVLMLGFDVRHAIGTSLVVIALNCAGGVLGRLRSDGTVLGVHWEIAAVFAAFGVLGAEVGGRLAHRLPQAVLRKVFAAVVTAMAVVLLAREFA
jgi:uncharacterized membrane protein YfcA